MGHCSQVEVPQALAADARAPAATRAPEVAAPGAPDMISARRREKLQNATKLAASHQKMAESLEASVR